MSKRSRDGDVLLDRTRHCYAPSFNSHKRPAAFDMVIHPKRQRFEIPSSKRPAAFDIEMDRLHKRLRATVPTAEEAIAFLVPHMERLRHLYCESQAQNTTLKKHLETMSRAYGASLEQSASLSRQLDASQAEVAALRRQVDFMKYRFALTEKSTKSLCTTNP